MTQYKKVVSFTINRHDGAAQYDFEIHNALRKQSNDYSFEIEDVNKHVSLPRFLALIIFWIRAQYMFFFKHIDIAIVSPSMMFILPKRISIISISHHYDPSVFRGLKFIYVKLYHWLFICQRSRVNLVVTPSKYWRSYYKEKGFKNVVTIFNGFDVESMDRAIFKLDSSTVLKKLNLVSKEYFHLGSYGIAKGQKKVFKHLKHLGFPMVLTSSSKYTPKNGIKDLKLINANFEEYNILLKNAKAVICMSEFKEGWCRVLHEAAIHGTPILGSGLGGMKELLEIGGFSNTTIDTLHNDLNIRTKKDSLSRNTINLYREFTLEKFHMSWRNCVNELLK